MRRLFLSVLIGMVCCAAGASAVSVGTMTFHDPSAPLRVQQELLTLLDERGFATVADAVGVAHRGGLS